MSKAAGKLNDNNTNEQQRIQALHGYDILDTPTEHEFDNLTKLAALICHAPMAHIILIDENRHWFKSVLGNEVRAKEVPREPTFSEYAILSEDVLEVPDALLDERFSSHPMVVGPPFIRFYAGAPLLDEQGFKLGAICAYGPEPKTLTAVQKEGLETLAQEVMTHISYKKTILELKIKSKRFEELSFVASKVNNAVVINDANNHVTWVNDAFEKITGYNLEDLKGKRLGDLISGPETDLELLAKIRKLIKQHQSFTVDILAYRKDSKPIWLSVYNTVILDEQGEVDVEVEIIIDITDKKAAERELLEAKEQALQLSEAKEMFLSVMSHEIRTPLNAVLGMTYLLLDNDPKPSQLDDLNILKFSGENLLSIINDILDFTKIETGNMQLETIPFSLKALVNDMITSLQVNINKRSNVLNLVLDERLPDQMMGDKTRLYQILMNLLGNAIKFTERGTVELRIELKQECEDLVEVYFEVRDTGIGIPKDKLNYIFETFTQAKTDISRKYGGTGLGLAITRRLLKLYQSEIQVQSEEGKGSAFSFAITFQKFSSPKSIPAVSTQLAAFEGKRVLVVDDNEINILIARRIFSKWGLLIDFASTGYEAIDKIKCACYDLVFMDIKMPGIDGFETAMIIRELPGNHFKELPIIALTASTLNNESGRFKDAGMNGHILKPFNPEEIKKLLLEYLG